MTPFEMTAPHDWPIVKLGWVLRRSKESSGIGYQLLTVNLPEGVRLRGEGLDDRPAPSEDLSAYLVVRPGQLVMNPLGKPHGSLGVSEHLGITSPAYFVADMRQSVNPRFLHFALRTRLYISEYERRGKWMPPSQFNISWDQFREITLALPPLDTQRKIASFLDCECARIATLDEELKRYALDLAAPALETFRRLTDGMKRGRIGYQFEVQLGKMLDETRIDFLDVSPYLRNANIHWDRLVLDDVKDMTFSAPEKQKFMLKPGDLLVCEGGEPGRAAVWNDEIDGCYFQKALHRVRPYADASPRFLLWCLRDLSERGAFKSDGPGRYTHLTAEQLRAVRVPMPDAAAQATVAAIADAEASAARTLGREVQAVARLLVEYRDALITEAVTGQIDVTRLSDAQMDQRLDTVRKGERPEVLAS